MLIVGERGTGKELIAERLHFLSNRSEDAFLKMNCAAISEALLESELFGHEAGAFTGATKTHRGRFERADGGTLFLDELANTSPLVQEKLLRVIEYGEYERVGGNRTQRTDVRLVAATNEDLPRLAEAGKFRADLLDRLAFDVITLPPLRERRTDILLLAERFAINMARDLGRAMFPGFSRAAQERLLAHGWPGNVRELKNVVERCVYRADADSVVHEITLDPFDSPYRPATDGRPQTAASRANAGLAVQSKGGGAGFRDRRHPPRLGDGQAQPRQGRRPAVPDLPPVARLPEEIRNLEQGRMKARPAAASHSSPAQISPSGGDRLNRKLAQPCGIVKSLRCSRRLMGRFSSDVPHPHDARFDDLGVDAAQIQLAANAGVDELHGFHAESGHELAAAGVGRRSHLEQRLAKPQPGARRQVGRRSSPSPNRAGPPPAASAHGRRPPAPPP